MSACVGVRNVALPTGQMDDSSSRHQHGETEGTRASPDTETPAVVPVVIVGISNRIAPVA